MGNTNYYRTLTKEEIQEIKDLRKLPKKQLVDSLLFYKRQWEMLQQWMNKDTTH